MTHKHIDIDDFPLNGHPPSSFWPPNTLLHMSLLAWSPLYKYTLAFSLMGTFLAPVSISEARPCMHDDDAEGGSLLIHEAGPLSHKKYSVGLFSSLVVEFELNWIYSVELHQYITNKQCSM